jgi:hypothetical protein
VERALLPAAFRRAIVLATVHYNRTETAEIAHGNGEGLGVSFWEKRLQLLLEGLLRLAGGAIMSLYVRAIRGRRSRPAAILLILAGLLLLSGCWVTSINPLYEQGKDPDVVVEPVLAGTWSFTDDQCVTTLTITVHEQGYDLQYESTGEKCSDAGKVIHQEAHLVKLGAHEFLDVEPRAADVCDMCLAKHQIFLAKIGKDSATLTPIDSEWLEAAIQAKTVTLATLPDDTDTLTASTKDLKEFCRKYAEDQAAFKPSGLVLKRS